MNKCSVLESKVQVRMPGYSLAKGHLGALSFYREVTSVSHKGESDSEHLLVS